MKFRDDDILNDLIFDFYILFDNLQVDERIPLSAKCMLIHKYLKIIQKEYKELIK